MSANETCIDGYPMFTRRETVDEGELFRFDDYRLLIDVFLNREEPRMWAVAFVGDRANPSDPVLYQAMQAVEGTLDKVYADQGRYETPQAAAAAALLVGL